MEQSISNNKVKTLRVDGLARAKQLYEHRDKRARELKEKGSLVVGYHCCYVPAEILTAAGVIPFRITGDTREQVSRVDSFLETQMCPHVRNCLELAVKGRYAFLDGVVIPHTCDAVQRSYGYWRHNVKTPRLHYLDVPHVSGDAAAGFFAHELRDFKADVEKWTGKQITSESLRIAIAWHNENRRLVKSLYSLRKRSPPAISGTEVLQVLVAGLSMPVEEFSAMLRDVIRDADSRAPVVKADAVRVLVTGCGIDDLPILELIESSGAVIVMDDLPVGSRSFWLEVDESGDPVDALARAYLGGIHCPRTIVGEKTAPKDKDLAQRFGYILDYCREYQARAVLLYMLRFCDPHQFDAPDLVQYLNNAGIKSLVIDDDYVAGGKGQLKTRIETLVESIVFGTEEEKS